MQLRRATPDDHAVVGRVTVAAYAPFLSQDGPDTAYVEHLADAAGRDRDAELWVAEESGRVLGSVTICTVGSPWRELARPGEGEFRMLSVDPDAQGRGVGRALVDLTLQRFRDAGAAAVVLCSMKEMTGAHRLYERVGFERDPARDWSPLPGVELLAYLLTFPTEETR
ncbi:MAG: GNAT family N-acetyltransferase [Nocardioides sp.]|jgi:ribosomal protein S18 acetylase RimI-like enzyme